MELAIVARRRRSWEDLQRLIQKADAQAGTQIRRDADTQKPDRNTTDTDAEKQRHSSMELAIVARAQKAQLGAGFWVRQVEKIEREEKVRVICSNEGQSEIFQYMLHGASMPCAEYDVLYMTYITTTIHSNKIELEENVRVIRVYGYIRVLVVASLVVYV
jgi:hypothetical protein